MGKRALMVAAWLPYVLGVPVLLLLSLFTWIATGKCVHEQLDWYLDKGTDFYRWAVGGKVGHYDDCC